MTASPDFADTGYIASAPKSFKVSVLMMTGDVEVHTAPDESTARAHTAYILESGYRSANDDGSATFWPPHQIAQVDITPVTPIQTSVAQDV